MIRLYHGSNIKIETPDLIHSKPFKDFGRGFYLSPNKQQALFVLANRDKQQAAKGITFQYFFGTERALQSLKLL